MAKDLTTLASYKVYAGINSTNQDAAINAIIPRVSALVKTLCRRTFLDYYDDPKVELFNGGTNQFNLYLEEYPVVSVNSVEYSADNGATYTSLVEFVDYTIDWTDNAIVSLSDSGFPRAINGYRVTYTGGYESLPVDLELAVLDLITYYLKNDQSVHSPKAPGTNSVQIEYITSTGLPSHIKRVIDKYVGSFD